MTDEPDDLDTYLAEARQDPLFDALYQDGHARDHVLDTLVALRKTLQLTQAEVGRRMGISQSRVAVIEREGSDPRVSTLQRYARALDARLRLKLVLPEEAAGA